MKKWFGIFVVFFALFSCLVFTTNASAMSQGWHYVTIEQAGPMFGVIIAKVSATRGDFTGSEYLELNPLMDKVLLATILTAMSQGTGTEVRVWVKGDPHPLLSLTVQTCLALQYIAP